MTPQPSDRMQVLVTVRRVCGQGLTREVENTLKYNPLRQMTLRDILDAIRPGALKGDVNAILDKLVRVKAEAIKTRVHNGRRMVNAYQWRLPGVR